ncbi:hypothetical protein BKA93DRAFT_272617 [Sparassis latifolia]
MKKIATGTGRRETQQLVDLPLQQPLQLLLMTAVFLRDLILLATVRPPSIVTMLWVSGGGSPTTTVTATRSDRLVKRAIMKTGATESDNRSLAVDTKFGDKRIPDGPSSAKSLPPSTPSAPRAMASGDGSRNLKPDPSAPRDRDWKVTPIGPSASLGSVSSSQDVGISGGSLRSRIGAKEPPPLPQAPSSYRSEAAADRKSDLPNRDDERDGSRKRTLSEREKEAGDAAPGTSESAGPPKRPRINRNRYPSIHGVVKNLLPLEQQADKSRTSRNP